MYLFFESVYKNEKKNHKIGDIEEWKTSST